MVIILILSVMGVTDGDQQINWNKGCSAFQKGERLWCLMPSDAFRSILWKMGIS